MAATTQARPREGAGIGLPAIDVERFEQMGHLMEAIIDENVDLFVRKGQDYREAHRAGTKRALTYEEATQLAIAAVDDRPVEERAAAFQGEEGLYAYDQPDRREVLIAAGVATAPAFVKACRRAVALLEMPTDDFWDALDNDRLPAAIDTAADALRKLPLLAARARTTAALEHFASEAGEAGGKGLGLLAQTMWAALMQAMSQMGDDTESPQSSLIASPPDTGGTSGPSSEPATAAPSN